MRKTWLLLLVGVFLSIWAFAGQIPDSVLAKVQELKSLTKQGKEMPTSLGDIPVIDGEKAYQLYEQGAVFIDLRKKEGYQTEKVPGSIWMDINEIITNPAVLEKLDKNKVYVTLCNGVGCWKSPACALIMKALGFKNVYWYRGGFPDWQENVYPVE